MINIEANYQDGGVMLSCKIDGKGEEIVCEATTIFMQLPQILADKHPEVFAAIADRLEQLVPLQDMTDRRQN